MRQLRWLVLIAAVVLVRLKADTTDVAAGAQSPGAQSPRHAQLVIVVDGLRPDYVTREVMPRVYRLGQRGIVFTEHHSVFPTVTRVNVSSIVTGAYPET